MKKRFEKIFKRRTTKENQKIIENVENNILKSEERIKELEKKQRKFSFF